MKRWQKHEDENLNTSGRGASGKHRTVLAWDYHLHCDLRALHLGLSALQLPALGLTIVAVRVFTLPTSGPLKPCRAALPADDWGTARAGGAIRELDAGDIPGLNLRQRNALKAAIKSENCSRTGFANLCRHKHCGSDTRPLTCNYLQLPLTN